MDKGMLRKSRSQQTTKKLYIRNTHSMRLWLPNGAAVNCKIYMNAVLSLLYVHEDGCAFPEDML